MAQASFSCVLCAILADAQRAVKRFYAFLARFCSALRDIQLCYNWRNRRRDSSEMAIVTETFISYARRDGLAFAEQLERDLPNTWRDKRNLNPFNDFTAELEKAIQAARQVLVCITPDVLCADSFVRREISYALYLKKPVLVARLAWRRTGGHAAHRTPERPQL
jgi:hypothetical protein